MNRIYKLFILIAATALFISCAKEESHTSTIPYATVEIDINTITRNKFVSQAFYSEEFTQGIVGYAGVIAISNADFSFIYAYDMCCPYESPQKNLIKPLYEYSLQAKCPKCGTIYNIGDGTGSVKSGVGNEKLRQYRVILDGDYYRIRN